MTEKEHGKYGDPGILELGKHVHLRSSNAAGARTKVKFDTMVGKEKRHWLISYEPPNPRAESQPSL